MSTYLDLKNRIADQYSYATIATQVDIRGIINRAVKYLVQDIDLASCKRRYSSQLNLFDQIYQYSCPQDIKGQGMIDLQPQVIDRDPNLEWILTPKEEFERRKVLERGLVSIYQENGVKKLSVSIATVNWLNSVINDTPLENINIKSYIVSLLDSLSQDGYNWQTFGDATNLRVDSVNYVSSNASLEFDINGSGGTTAGIYHDNLTAFDISNYIEEGFAFVFARINDSTNITDYKIRIGSSSSDYYELTATQTIESLAFASGWNLLQFNFTSATKTGNPDPINTTYVAVFMDKDASKINQLAFGFDQIQLKAGNIFNMIYYSEYGWQTSAGLLIKDSTADTDVLNLGDEEFELAIIKGKELLGEELREYNQVSLQKSNYEQQKQKYMLNNPSEAKVLNTTYREF